MKKQLTMGFLISLCLLSGCTKNNENIERDVNTTPNEHLTRDIVDSEGNIIANINADIIYPQVKDVPVATLKKYEFTNNDIQRIATAIYGDSEYYKALQPSECSVNDLNTTINYYNEKLADLNQLYNENKIGVNSDYYNNKLIDYTFKISECNYYITKAHTEVDTSPVLEFYDVIFDTWSSTYNQDTESEEFTFISSDAMQKCSLQGTYNAMPCNIEFFSPSDLHIEMNADDTCVWKNYTYKEIDTELPNVIYYDYYASNNPNIENDCIFSIDQAIEMCSNMVEAFHISNMDVMDIYNIPVKAYNVSSIGNQYGGYIDDGYCGYIISYGKSINSINSNIFTYDGVIDLNYGLTSDDFSNSSDPEYLTFIVMDCGIISISYSAPTILDNITSTNTAILDFDTILNLADIYLPNIYADIKGIGYKHEFEITRIQFGLARITNNSDNSDFSLIPVWTFYQDGSFSPILTINAIDGNNINSYTGIVIELD